MRPELTRAPQVWAPTTPSGASPRARWKATRARRGPGTEVAVHGHAQPVGGQPLLHGGHGVAALALLDGQHPAQAGRRPGRLAEQPGAPHGGDPDRRPAVWRLHYPTRAQVHADVVDGPPVAGVLGVEEQVAGRSDLSETSRPASYWCRETRGGSPRRPGRRSGPAPSSRSCGARRRPTGTACPAGPGRTAPLPPPATPAPPPPAAARPRPAPRPVARSGRPAPATPAERNTGGFGRADGGAGALACGSSPSRKGAPGTGARAAEDEHRTEGSTWRQPSPDRPAAPAP
jgi:hypothetical protein